MNPPASSGFETRTVRCPGCEGRTLYSPRNPYRPFCSARCKGLDLGAWSQESFRLAQDVPADADQND
jgi:endogenous inhibitor of DNA gyrase (YacG/DUF329 family)